MLGSSTDGNFLTGGFSPKNLNQLNHTVRYYIGNTTSESIEEYC
jgi:hypothetical protein